MDGIAIIKLDYDAERLSSELLEQRAERACVTIRSVTIRKSPSGRGWHVELEVSPAPSSAMEAVALQLLFGSDPLREAYNINRARKVDRGNVPAFWRGRWNVLYRGAVD